MRSPSSRYAEILEGCGLYPKLRGIWLSVGSAGPTQGWKLHLSSIPTEAPLLLSLALPILVQSRATFKVANDESVLSRLNEGELGSTQVGKFVTVYPRSDSEACDLAERLVERTKGLHGPFIISDLKLGDVTYSRYGAYEPIISYNRLGQVSLSIREADGTLSEDLRRVPFSVPTGVLNPFADRLGITDLARTGDPPAPPPSDALNPRGLFGPGYLVIEVLSYRAKGAIFRAIDLRDHEQVEICIIKQGRQHCLSDEHGRDIRTRLRHQEALHHNLQGRVPIAKAGAYFEVNGDGYLPLEDLDGESVETFAVRNLINRSWRGLQSADKRRLLICIERIVSAVESLHSAGYVHRDLSASNIWVGKNGEITLLDLELAHRINDVTPAYQSGTAGFMSPAQQAHAAPTYADDVYGLGCVMVLLVTGLDPRRVLFAKQENRVDQLRALTNDCPLALIEKIAECVDPNAAARPSLESVKRVTTQCMISNCVDVPTFADVDPSESASAEALDAKNFEHVDFHRSLINGSQIGLLRSCARDQQSGLWLSTEDQSQSKVGLPSLRVQRYAHKGVAGVVYLVGRLARFGFSNETVRDQIAAAVHWLVVSRDSRDARLPGLHFGEAGVAVAIAEAVAGGVIERDSRMSAFLEAALCGVLDWPDVTHGAAGQGIAAIYCADRLQEQSLFEYSHRCADYLIRSQKADGSWEMPPGVDGMSGETLTGFAHGVGGIVYFLAAYSGRTSSAAALSSWLAGAEWLITQASPGENELTLSWPYSDSTPDHWRWWCHGAPGIGLAFLRIYEQTGFERYADVARRALRVHPFDIRYPNLSQCHGLSGIGEIYLEAGRVLGNQEWTRRAYEIARVLSHLSRQGEDGSVSWLAEDADTATADLMVGTGGVTHFLLRSTIGTEILGPPLLLDPIA